MYDGNVHELAVLFETIQFWHLTKCHACFHFDLRLLGLVFCAIMHVRMKYEIQMICEVFLFIAMPRQSILSFQLKLSRPINHMYTTFVAAI